MGGGTSPLPAERRTIDGLWLPGEGRSTVVRGVALGQLTMHQRITSQASTSCLISFLFFYNPLNLRSASHRYMEEELGCV